MKRNIIAIGMVFAVLMSFASCKKLPQDNEFIIESQVYAVDDEGVTRELKTEFAGNNVGDNNGNKSDKDLVYYYEDTNGNKVTVKHKDVVVATTKVRKTTTQPAGFEGMELTPEEESLLNSFNDPDAFENLVDESLTEPELEIYDQLIPEDNFEKIEVEVDSDGNPKHDDIEKRYTDIIESGKFTIDMVIKSKNDGQETIVPMCVIRDGDKIYLETAMPINGEGSMKMAFLNRNNQCYFIIPGMRAYMTVPSEDISQFFNTDMIETDSEATYISSNEVEFNGKKYICDVYESEGSTVKYYYTKNEIKRMEATDPNGNTTIMEFNTVSDKVDSSKFRVPSGYIDMTKFMNYDLPALSGVTPAVTSKATVVQ